MNLTREELEALMEDVARKAIQTEVSKWATKQYFPDLIFEPGQVAMFNATHHRLMPSSTAGGGGHILQDDGTSLTDRTYADFQDGFVLTDDSAGDATEIDLDYATTEIADIAEVEAAGTSSKVPRADHVHSGQAYVLEASANYVDLTDGGATTLHSHSGGAGTLDDAYDFGGAGSGRTINTTDGAVLLQTTEADAAPNLDLRRAAADSGRSALQVGINSEANPRLDLLASGAQQYGAGGASPVDLETLRSAAGTFMVRVPGGAAATIRANNLGAQTTATARVTLVNGIVIQDAVNMAPATATITAGGAVVVTAPWMQVAANGGPGADDLDIIDMVTGGTISPAEGDVVYVSAQSGNTITVRDKATSGAGAGGVQTPGGTSITLDAPEKIVAFFYKDANNLYACPLFSTGGGANHAILDGSVHTDSVAQGVTRGSLIYGNATPAWDELVVGAANTVLVSNGTDVSWDPAPQLANIQDTSGNTRITTAAASPQVTLTGDVVLGAGFLKFNPTLSVGAAYNLISTPLTATITAGSVLFNLIDLTPTLITTDAAIDTITVNGVNGTVAFAPEDSTVGHTIRGLNFTASAVSTSLGAAASATIAAMYGADVLSNINVASGKTITATAMTGIRVRITTTGAGTQNATDAFLIDAPNPSAFDALTNLYGLRIGALTRGGTLNVGVDIGQPSGATTNIGLRNAGQTVFTPSTAQSIAVSAPIVANATFVMISTTTAANMTATPTVADGADGQILIIVNTGANTFTLQDQGTLGSSNLRLSAAGVALATRDSIILMYSSTVGDWIEIGQSNVI